MVALFDDYEIRARLAPTALVGGPVLLFSIALAEVLAVNLTQSALVLGLLLLILYAGSFGVRYLGRMSEDALWVDWEGAPSTRLLRDSDSDLHAGPKESIRAKIAEVFQIGIDPGSDQEDSQISDAFALVRQRIRQTDPKGLWQRHNAEYGFLRNLWGSLHVWALLSGAATLAAGILFYYSGSLTAALAVAVNGVTTIALPILGKRLLAGPLRTAADRYGESCWIAFLNS